MFYAASEIVFWILLAAIAGGGIGYGVAQTRLVRLNKRLSQSRADAPMERELAIAWDTIEDLNRRLQVAHETIRDTSIDVVAPTDVEQVAADLEDQPELAVPVPETEPEPEPVATDSDTDSDNDTVIDMSAARHAATEPADVPSAPVAPQPKKESDSAAKSAAKVTAPKSAASPTAAPDPDRNVGTRLSERVASASLANNGVDFTDGA